MNLSSVRSWLLDCDGVILDSNRLKSEAFYELALPYGIGAATRLVEYHRSHGGISRFNKIKYLFESVLNVPYSESDVSQAIERFGAIVRAGLLTAPETKGIREFLACIPSDSRRVVVSGGQQDELREIFEARDLARYFDGIFGSPATKYEILRQELTSGHLKQPAVMIGDSLLDYQVASEFEVDFIFMSSLTEFDNWSEFFLSRSVKVIDSTADLIPHFLPWKS